MGRRFTPAALRPAGCARISARLGTGMLLPRTRQPGDSGNENSLVQRRRKQNLWKVATLENRFTSRQQGGGPACRSPPGHGLPASNASHSGSEECRELPAPAPRSKPAPRSPPGAAQDDEGDADADAANRLSRRRIGGAVAHALLANSAPLHPYSGCGNSPNSSGCADT
jgi:hypothetical protein